MARRPGAVFRVSRINALVPVTASTNCHVNSRHASEKVERRPFAAEDCARGPGQLKQRLATSDVQSICER